MAAHCAPAYRPRSGTRNDAQDIVREHLPQFVARLEQEASATLPAFVTDELQRFTTCGDFEQGFLLAACRRCGEQLRVPFSCKARGVCPSCIGRRMGESAALMVDHRLPAVPYRQWVLSFSGGLATRLGYDRKLLGLVCERFGHRVMQSLRGVTKKDHARASVRDLSSGVLIVVQRFRYDLRLFVHLHALVFDGCFAPQVDGEPRFLAASSLAAPHLSRVLERLHHDLNPSLEDQADEPDLGVQACLQLAARTGPRPMLEDSPATPRPMCVAAFGMQLHAEVCFDGRDRRRLERMCRYFLRPPFAREAITNLQNGDVRIHFKQPTTRGTTYVDISRDVFLARLAALVPSPGFNMVRYYGALANGHHLNQIIRPQTETTQVKQLSLFELRPTEAVPLRPGRTALEQALLEPTPRRLSWGKLLGRVFQIDVEVCAKCGGPMRVLEAVTEPAKIAAALHGARPPPRPSPPGQTLLFQA